MVLGSAEPSQSKHSCPSLLPPDRLTRSAAASLQACVDLCRVCVYWRRSWKEYLGVFPHRFLHYLQRNAEEFTLSTWARL
ncbi:hypothetical protein RRG08_058319 [Elysia crispata]|uniref:Uncharacterized protein n=1 Tax=Elysia crispata TaxID=231223 RepID=A0AAE1D5F5_9GAST|nr:hypothetical protein RRG08_058319 [Elysia crispata]